MSAPWKSRTFYRTSHRIWNWTIIGHTYRFDWFDSRTDPVPDRLSVNNLHHDDNLTRIWRISGTSGSVISGQKIRTYFFGFDDVTPDRKFVLSWWHWTTSVTLTITYRFKSRDIIIGRYHMIGEIIPEILEIELEIGFFVENSRIGVKVVNEKWLEDMSRWFARF